MYNDVWFTTLPQNLTKCVGIPSVYVLETKPIDCLRRITLFVRKLCIKLVRSPKVIMVKKILTWLRLRIIFPLTSQILTLFGIVCMVLMYAIEITTFYSLIPRVIHSLLIRVVINRLVVNQLKSLWPIDTNINLIPYAIWWELFLCSKQKLY